MLILEQAAPADATATERVVLSFELRCKCRLRTRSAAGEDVGLYVARGSVLRHGDKFTAQDGRVVEIVAAPEALMAARSNDPLLLARAAYHLGNRHVAVQLGAGWLRFASDHVLQEMLLGLGLQVSEMIAPFTPEAGAYGHGHTHGGTTSTDAKLHLYRGPT
jgi:urease accessory protein